MLTTLGFAEAYYRMAAEAQLQKRILLTPSMQKILGIAKMKKDLALYSGAANFNVYIQKLVDMGDRYLNRVQFHANTNESLSEQMYRDTGYIISAVDLTWNYAALLSALDARTKVFENQKERQ